MKLLIAMLVFTSPFCARAGDKIYVVEGKTSLNKADAIFALVKNPNARVEECKIMELTKKATLREK